MVAKIGRQIGNTDSVRGIALAPPDRHRKGWAFVGDVVSGAGMLNRRARAPCQQLKRIGHGAPLTQSGLQLSAFLVEMRPIADMHLSVQVNAFKVIDIGIELDRPPVARYRLVESLEAEERRPSIVIGM